MTGFHSVFGAKGLSLAMVGLLGLAMAPGLARAESEALRELKGSQTQVAVKAAAEAKTGEAAAGDADLAPAAVTPATSSNRPVSRLSQLIRQTTQVYLPTRIILGQENTVVVRGKPGRNVLLYLSPENTGMVTGDGLALRVGTNNEQLKGVIPDNGVLSLQVPFPNDPGLEGRLVFVDAVSWSAPDLTDVERADLVSAEGRRTDDNKLTIYKASAGKGSMILPAMPGMSPQIMQQLNNLSILQDSDPRKKELLDTGELNREKDLRDQNSFWQRPGGLQAPAR